jgi:sulfur-oxidizing protein SoxZ
MAEPMKIRATLEGDAANIKVLMNHVMETGQRKDAKTGQLVPAHFIQTVVANLNGKVVLEAQWSQAVSKNPFLGFKVKGAKAGDKVNISWADNKGEKNSADATVS